MRFVKLFFISLFVLFLALLAISSLIPAHLRLSRAIDIRTSPNLVFNSINDLHNWKKWNQFIIGTPLTHLVISDQGAGPGAMLRSDQLQILIQRSSPDSIRTLWTQSRGKHFSGGYNLMELKPGIVTVQSYFDFTFAWYPWEKLSSLLYESEIGTLMEQSLSKLKEITEIK